MIRNIFSQICKLMMLTGKKTHIHHNSSIVPLKSSFIIQHYENHQR